MMREIIGGHRDRYEAVTITANNIAVGIGDSS